MYLPCAKLMDRNSEGSVQTGFQNCSFQFHRLTYPGPSTQREVKRSFQNLGEPLKKPYVCQAGVYELSEAKLLLLLVVTY